LSGDEATLMPRGRSCGDCPPCRLICPLSRARRVMSIPHHPGWTMIGQGEQFSVTITTPPIVVLTLRVRDYALTRSVRTTMGDDVVRAGLHRLWMPGTLGSPSRFSSSLACGENRQPMRLLFCQVRLVLALLALLAGAEGLRAAGAGTPPPFYDVV